jgi:acyl-CoA thioester hydrolase
MNNANASPDHVHEMCAEVRYAESDQMGFAHHSTAAVWFELGRVGWLRDAGLSYRKLEEDGVLLPVVRLDIRYVAPARFEDVVVIQSRVIEVTRVRVIFANRVLRETHGQRTVLAEGEVELACVNRQGRPQRLPQDVHVTLTQAICAGRWPDVKVSIDRG